MPNVLNAAQTAEFLDQCRLRSAVADDALDLLFQPLYDCYVPIIRRGGLRSCCRGT